MQAGIKTGVLHKIANINNSKTNMTSVFDDQITWELPRSTQPWPRTVSSFNPDPPRSGIQDASSLGFLSGISGLD